MSCIHNCCCRSPGTQSVHACTWLIKIVWLANVLQRVEFRKFHVMQGYDRTGVPTEILSLQSMVHLTFRNPSKHYATLVSPSSSITFSYLPRQLAHVQVNLSGWSSNPWSDLSSAHMRSSLIQTLSHLPEFKVMISGAWNPNEPVLMICMLLPAGGKVLPAKGFAVGADGGCRGQVRATVWSGPEHEGGHSRESNHRAGTHHLRHGNCAIVCWTHDQRVQPGADLPCFAGSQHRHCDLDCLPISWQQQQPPPAAGCWWWQTLPSTRKRKPLGFHTSNSGSSESSQGFF